MLLAYDHERLIERQSVDVPVSRHSIDSVNLPIHEPGSSSASTRCSLGPVSRKVVWTWRSVPTSATLA